MISSAGSTSQASMMASGFYSIATLVTKQANGIHMIQNRISLRDSSNKTLTGWGLISWREAFHTVRLSLRSILMASFKIKWQIVL